jgi:hypothetical protein
VEPPVHVGVQQPPHGVHVAALHGAVQLLHHRLAADNSFVAAAAMAYAGVAAGIFLAASQLCELSKRGRRRRKVAAAAM